MQWHLVLRIACIVFKIVCGTFRAGVYILMEYIGIEVPSICALPLYAIIERGGSSDWLQGLDEPAGTVFEACAQCETC